MDSAGPGPYSGCRRGDLPERYEFLEAIPKTSTGKFWKMKLRERFPR